MNIEHSTSNIQNRTGRQRIFFELSLEEIERGLIHFGHSRRAKLRAPEFEQEETEGTEKNGEGIEDGAFWFPLPLQRGEDKAPSYLLSLIQWPPPSDAPARRAEH